MKLTPTKIVHPVHPGKIILPLLIGIGVAIYIFTREGSLKAFSAFQFSPAVVIFLFMAAMMIVTLITGYVSCLRVLSEGRYRATLQLLSLPVYCSRDSTRLDRASFKGYSQKEIFDNEEEPA